MSMTKFADPLGYISSGKNRRRGRASKWLTDLHRRATKKGRSFNLTAQDLIIPSHCPILGIPLFFSTGTGFARDNTPSVDRIDNNEGYVRGNIQIISWKANKLKNTLLVEDLPDLKKVISYMEKREVSF